MVVTTRNVADNFFLRFLLENVLLASVRRQIFAIHSLSSSLLHRLRLGAAAELTNRFSRPIFLPCIDLLLLLICADPGAMENGKRFSIPSLCTTIACNRFSDFDYFSCSDSEIRLWCIFLLSKYWNSGFHSIWQYGDMVMEEKK